MVTLPRPFVKFNSSKNADHRNKKSWLRQTVQVAVEALEERTLLSGWTSVTPTNNSTFTGDGAMNMLLLPNGTVMIHGAGNSAPQGASTNWYLLQPDSTGSYTGATAQQITTLAAMTTGRRFFATNVLPNDTVFAYGGEDISTQSGQVEANSGEFFTLGQSSSTPWGTLPTIPTTLLPSNAFGDQSTELLNNGTILSADPGDGAGSTDNSFVFNLPAHSQNDANGTWTATANQANSTGDNEDNWVLLPNGDVLDYEIRVTDNANAATGNTGGTGFAELYVPSGGAIPANDGGGTSTGQWVNADSSTTPTLIQLTSNTLDGDEGPGVLLPYYAPFNGPAAMYIGANGSTAFYNPATNTWTSSNTNSYDAEPTYNIPGGANNVTMASEDGPAAVLPNGDLLVALCQAGTNGNYPGPTRIYLFNPFQTTGASGSAFTDVTPNDSTLASTANPANSPGNAYHESMLVLPTGQVLMSDNTSTLWVYTPATTTPAAGSQPIPTISSITTDPSTGLLQITGTGLNGADEGAYYGDDQEMSSNYPLVQLTTTSGNIVYATTSNWQPGLGGSAGTSTDFTLPAGTTLSDYTSVTVIANGIPSVAVPALASPTVIPPSNQSSMEGASQVFNLGSFIDPSGSAWTVDVNWGDGTPDTTFSASPGSLGTQSHTYAEEGTYTPTVTVRDTTNNLSGSASFQVVVADPAVIPTGGFTFSAIEGALSTSQTVATFTDPGGAEPNSFAPGPISSHYTATIDWGDSSPTSTGSITYVGSPDSTTGVFTVTGSHTYGEEGTYTITVTISHESAPNAMTTSTAKVSDPAVLGTGTTINAIACLPLTGVTAATFTDPGGAEPNPSASGPIDTHYQVVSINWGDGTPLDTTTGAISYSGSPGSQTDPFTVSGSHTYAQEGTYTITTIIRHEEAPETTIMSTAIVKDNIGLLVLDPLTSGALAVSGNGNVTVNNCGAVVVDSSNPTSAAMVTGNGLVSAMDIDVTGGALATGNGKFSGPIGHEPPTADPIGLPLPPVPAATFGAVNFSGPGTLMLSPGTYLGGIRGSGKGTLMLEPGVYYLMGGGLQLSGNSSLTGAGVLIVNAPSNRNDGIALSGNAIAILSAPLPATLPGGYAAYKGITIFQDPASTLPIDITGNAGLTMDGALYAPHGTLNISGNGSLTDYTDTTAPVAEVIVDQAQVTGNGMLTIDADAAASNPPANTPVPGAAQASFVSLVSSPNPSVPGQPITLTATMSSTPPPGVPAGSIDFFDLTTHLDLGSVTLVGGVATLTTSALTTLGNQTISATYFPASPNFTPPNAPATLTQQVQSEAVEFGVLFVGGNPNSNTIQVSLNNGEVIVNLNGGSPTFNTPQAGLTALMVYGQGNGEHIQAASNLLLPAFLFAGNGTNVQIQGGGGPTVEVGGSGGGQLQGGLGRNILIAGSGGAQLRGGNGGSILIGGYTDYDTILMVLDAALMEWNSADSYAMRTGSLAAIFNTTSVHSDGLSDQLEGGGGTAALDWLFMGPLDNISGNNSSDTIVRIT
jgi:hypothetical protein